MRGKDGNSCVPALEIESAMIYKNYLIIMKLTMFNSSKLTWDFLQVATFFETLQRPSGKQPSMQ